MSGRFTTKFRDLGFKIVETLWTNEIAQKVIPTLLGQWFSLLNPLNYGRGGGGRLNRP